MRCFRVQKRPGAGLAHAWPPGASLEGDGVFGVGQPVAGRGVSVVSPSPSSPALELGSVGLFLQQSGPRGLAMTVLSAGGERPQHPSVPMEPLLGLG